MGRPPIFDTPDKLQEKIDEYFIWINGEKGQAVEKDGELIQQWNRYPEPATITGLALYLGFESRQSFYDYETREDFSYTIKKARLKIENEYEKKLSSNAVTGSIFALKNLGWKDKTEQDLNVHGAIIWQEQKTYETK